MSMTPEEIMSFQGHEFIYVFEDGDTMPAYIKKIDLDKNMLTFWSFSLVTDNGFEFTPTYLYSPDIILRGTSSNQAQVHTYAGTGQQS